MRSCSQCGHPLAVAEMFCPQCDASTEGGELAGEWSSEPGRFAEEVPDSRRRLRRDREKDLALLGRVIADKYRVLEVLGQGGFGSVFLVEMTSGIVGEKLAMKVLPLELTGNPRRREQFYQEIRIAMKMVNKYIVQIRDVGVTDDDVVYYTMDYVPGKSLGRVLREEKRLEPGRTLRIILRVLRAVMTAHAGGIIHRDLKPGNIMIQEKKGRETVRVLDFGIATAIGSDSAFRTGFTGSLYYAAPEQFHGQVSLSSDLYSVGVILYECLTGSRPYDGQSTREVYERMKAGPPVPAEDLAPEIAARPGLPAMVKRALKRNPQKRFQSAREFFSEVNKVLAAPLVEPERPKSPRRPSRTPSSTGRSPEASAPPRDQRPGPERPERRRGSAYRSSRSQLTLWGLTAGAFLLLAPAAALYWGRGASREPPTPPPATPVRGRAEELLRKAQEGCDEMEKARAAKNTAAAMAWRERVCDILRALQATHPDRNIRNEAEKVVSRLQAAFAHLGACVDFSDGEQ